MTRTKYKPIKCAIFTRAFCKSAQGCVGCIQLCGCHSRKFIIENLAFKRTPWVNWIWSGIGWMMIYKMLRQGIFWRMKLSFPLLPNEQRKTHTKGFCFNRTWNAFAEIDISTLHSHYMRWLLLLVTTVDSLLQNVNARFHFTYHVRWNEAQQPHARPETSQSNCRRGWKVNVSWHFFARLRIVTSSYCLMRTYSTERIKITYEKRATIEIHSPYAMNAFIRTSLRYKCYPWILFKCLFAFQYQWLLPHMQNWDLWKKGVQ